MKIARLIVPMLSLAMATAVHALPQQVIQPDEPEAKDAFAYQFLPTTDLNVDFFGVLPAVNTGSASQHSQQSFIQFDLSAVQLPAARVQSASLGLYEIASEATGFGSSPSATYNLDVSVHRATSSWPETLTWNTRPSFDSAATSTRTLDGSQIDDWVSYDVTGLVQQWLGNSSSNFGIAVTADHEVRDATQTAVIGVFDSSSTANKPKLTITFDAIPGDANLDDQVNVDDLSALAQNWQRTGDATWAQGDFDGDHNVTATDLGLLALNWQAGGPSFLVAAQGLGLPPTVPEPQSVLFVGLLLAGGRRRR